jgi:hypothetical protein
MKRFWWTAKSGACATRCSIFLTGIWKIFSYRDMEDHVQRINHFTSISSRELFKGAKRWRLGDALLRPAFRFFRSYILQRGFLEGFAGFHVAVMASVYVFLKYAKLWELELRGKDDGDRKRS